MKVLRFNQDASCCAVAFSGSSLSIYNCDPFGKCFELENGSNSSREDLRSYNAHTSSEDPPNFVIEMLFSTSLVVIVDKNQGLQKSKKLKVVNTKRKSTICELTFPHEIVDVVMNRKRMCILLSSDQIFIYDISCMKLLQTIDVLEDKLKDVVHRQALPPPSHTLPDVKLALSSDDRSILCYTAYSHSTSDSYLLNDVVIFDALNVTPINYLNTVHKGNITCLTVNHDGKLVATASEKGTIVRVFHTGADSDFDSNDPLFHEFRRGTRPCEIYGMKFDPQSSKLGVIGGTDTIHIFKLEKGRDIEDSPSASASSLMDNKFSRESSKQLASFISKKVMSKIPSQNLTRDFAHIKVKDSIQHFIGFPEEFPGQVYVASDDGQFQIFNLPSMGGECMLVKSSRFTI